MSTKNRISMAAVIAFCLLTTACVKRSANPGGNQESSTTAESSNLEEDDFKMDEGDASSTDSTTESTPTENSSQPWMDNNADNVTASEVTSAGPEIQMTGSVKEYVVKENDTLMLVAHNIYGDYKKWKEIKKLNKAELGGQWKKLKAGTILKYYEPSEPYVQEANGEPYLIQVKDTLGIVSKKVYQTPKHWKTIWKNNPYIKNPNLIFAGFTLYYTRDVKLAKGM